MEPRFGLAELCQGQRQDKALSLGMGLAGPCCSDPGMEKVLIPPVLEPHRSIPCQASALSVVKVPGSWAGAFLLLEGGFCSIRNSSCCCFSCLCAVKDPPFPGRKTISARLTASLKWLLLLI